MNIILLCGGAGMRLWPLSNGTQSKQFLRMFQGVDGNQESMIQRMYRQIKESGIDINHFVVATNAIQEDIIRSQLGDDIDIVLEPERRNTFPAVALSTAYLSIKKGCSDDESLIVLPVDTYAELDFFRFLQKMDVALASNLADIVLIGIPPTWPSTEYGYIVSKDEPVGEVKYVQKFIEKPEKKVAAKMINEGAVWNGGVFAVKLSYMMQQLSNHMQVKSYEEFRDKFSELEKESFDCKVVEKASSVAMIPYNGVWKDLGTWGTFMEEISPNINGAKVIVGENVKNTNIVNKTDIPLAVIGAKNLIIVASPDGFLVSDKESTSRIKSYVEKIDQRPRFEERRWGTYKIIDFEVYGNRQALTKHIKINANNAISYQRHAMRDEVWIFLDGVGCLLLDGKTRWVQSGDIVCISKGQCHALKAVTETHFIEVQIGEAVVEEDIERFQWSWE